MIKQTNYFGEDNNRQKSCKHLLLLIKVKWTRNHKKNLDVWQVANWPTNADGLSMGLQPFNGSSAASVCVCATRTIS